MQPTLAERNKQLALRAFDALFNRRDYDAASAMWAEGYIQHSTHIAPGRAGLFERARSLPTLRYENVLAVAEGDYVVLHGRFTGNRQPRPMIVANIIRVEDGRLAEHWDVIQDEATAEESKSGLPMIGDRFLVLESPKPAHDGE
jgi:predicted SnoaL-like aldol condensation-catalyzing enzyme